TFFFETILTNTAHGIRLYQRPNDGLDLFSGGAAASLNNPLDMSADLLHVIIDHLDLAAEFHLSQTCRALRHLTHRDWKTLIPCLPYRELLPFYIGLAYTRPDHWACERCCRLHRIPNISLAPRFGQSQTCGIRTDWTWTEGEEYLIQPGHVELALKLARTGANWGHLSRLTAPYHYSSSPDPTDLWHEASPRIVGGRFLLRKKTYVPIWSSIAAVNVCPHATLVSAGGHGMIPFLADRFCNPEYVRDELERALRNLGREVSGHCNYCPTDYSVVASVDECTVTAWYDFGSYELVRYYMWMTHCESPSHWLLNLDKLAIRHVPGSVRELYFRDLKEEE
ncbi:hypothetical protein CSHISOI_07178, partial [Colletotrichum shisoi]